MASYLGSKISPFTKKYLTYAGWTEERYIDPASVESDLLAAHWQCKLPEVWYEIVSSIDRLEPLTRATGLPRSGSEEARADGFRAYDLYFMAVDGMNNPWVSEDLPNHFGLNFGSLGLYHREMLWLVDENCRFYTYWEGRVAIFGSGLDSGLDSVFRDQPIERIELPYDPDTWDERFPPV